MYIFAFLYKVIPLFVIFRRRIELSQSISHIRVHLIHTDWIFPGNITAIY